MPCSSGLPEGLQPERRGTGPEKGTDHFASTHFLPSFSDPFLAVIKFGRIDWNGHFVTAMTTVAPNSRGSRVIHPLVSPHLPSDPLLTCLPCR